MKKQLKAINKFWFLRQRNQANLIRKWIEHSNKILYIFGRTSGNVTIQFLLQSFFFLVAADVVTADCVDVANAVEKSCG